MDQLQVLFKNASDRFQELSQGKKMAALALLAAAIGSLIAMSFWFQAPDYQLLYANLAEKDAAKIVEHLKGQKVPYELGGDGHVIRVPSNRVHEIRLQLATLGLPEGSEVGLELFQESTLGMTDFVQKLNYQRALQGELARTIKSLDAVDQARVHLVIPKETLFVKEKPKGKASVTLKLKAGKSLTQEQIQGVIHLISSSVEGISPSDVVIVDVKGNLLSGEQDGSEKGQMLTSNHKHQNKVEKEYEQKILKMLEDALGQGKVIARVSADLNFEKVERTEEIYDPESQVIRSEQRVAESTVGAVPPGGIAGVESLLPTGEASKGVPGSAAKKDRENQTLNYEINKVVRRVEKPVGEIKKISVGVLIDGTMAGTPPAYKARTPEEMATYLEIVKTAIGYDEKRGDQLKVENVQFDKTLAIEQEQKLKQGEQIDLGLQVAKYVLGLIFIMLFFSRVIRPMINWMTTTAEVIEEAPEMPSIDAAEEEKKRNLGTQAQQMRQTVGDFVATDPKYAAAVLRKWMKERTH
jgi:flagellar M-ring protein FliF